MLSTALLDQITDSLMTQAGEHLARDGFVQVAIYGFSQRGPAVTILQGPEGSEPQVVGERGIVLLPGPLRDRQSIVAALFDAADVQATAFVGEFWTYPQGEASPSFAANIPPSEHPRREEGVFVQVSWPLGGYLRFTSRRIARDGGRAGAEPWPEPGLYEVRQCDDDPPREPGDPSFFQTWVEDCLPARGQ